MRAYLGCALILELGQQVVGGNPEHMTCAARGFCVCRINSMRARLKCTNDHQHRSGAEPGSTSQELVEQETHLAASCPPQQLGALIAVPHAAPAGPSA